MCMHMSVQSCCSLSVWCSMHTRECAVMWKPEEGAWCPLFFSAFFSWDKVSDWSFPFQVGWLTPEFPGPTVSAPLGWRHRLSQPYLTFSVNAEFKLRSPCLQARMLPTEPALQSRQVFGRSEGTQVESLVLWSCLKDWCNCSTALELWLEAGRRWRRGIWNTNECIWKDKAFEEWEAAEWEGSTHSHSIPLQFKSSFCFLSPSPLPFLSFLWNGV